MFSSQNPDIVTVTSDDSEDEVCLDCMDPTEISKPPESCPGRLVVDRGRRAPFGG